MRALAARMSGFDRKVLKFIDFTLRPQALAAVPLSCVAMLAGPVPAFAQAVSQEALDEIVVSAPKNEASSSANADGLQPSPLTVVEDSIVPVTVVTGRQIDQSSSGSLGDILAQRPGIAASTFAPGSASRPIIRGLDNYRVKIQENGIGVGDASDFSEDHQVPIDPLGADQIEVVRGPSTLRYGSQAIGGVVNAKNNRIPEAMPPNSFNARFKGGYNSSNQGLDGAASFDAGGENIAIHFDTFGRNSSDYSIPGGRQANTAVRAEGVSVGASRIFDDGFVGVAISRYTSLYGIPGLEDARDRTRIDLEQTKITSKGEWRVQSSGLEAVRFWLGATDYQHKELGIGSDGIDRDHNTIKNKEQEGKLEFEHAAISTPMGSLTGASGVQFSHRALSTAGDMGGLLAPTDTMTFAGYLFEELRLTETLKLQGSGRIESARVSGLAPVFPSNFLPPPDSFSETDATRKFMPKSASMGLWQQLTWGMVATASAQYVERAPAAPELYSRGSDDASGTFVIGDPNLTIESAKGVELGLKRAQGRFRFDASGYYTEFKNFIFKQLTGNRCEDEFATCGAVGPLTQVIYSQRDAVFTGVELAGQFDVMPLGGGMLGIEAQFDYVQGKFADGTNVPRITPMRVGGGLLWRDANWSTRINLLHAFTQNNVAINETPTEGYDNLRMEVSYTTRFKPTGLGLHEMTVGISGDNLLNQDMRNHLSFKKNEVLLPGALVRMFASMKF